MSVSTYTCKFSTKGINLADEYINAVERFGYWKDSGICLEGKAAWSLTLMFLQTWQLCTKQVEDFAQFYPWQHTPCQIPTDGFVLPYGDSPMDAENVGEHVYMQILNQATDYVYISSMPWSGSATGRIPASVLKARPLGV